MLPSLILRNIFGHRMRSLLTILGISIGIAAIVTLGSVAGGIKGHFSRVMKAGGADFMVGQANAADLMLSAISEERADDLGKMEGVEKAVGVSMGIVQKGDIPYFMMFGIKREDFDLADISIIEGEAFEGGSEDELILGKVAARHFEKSVGDRIDVGGKEFTVKGIFETGNILQDGGAFANLRMVQRLFKMEGLVSMIFVKVAAGADITEVAQRIEDTYPNELVSIKSLDEVSKVDKGLVLMDAASLVVSLLAVVVGGIGVMNTMIMSVFERTREIGVLRAVGWRRNRVLRMILGESLLLGLGGFIAGSLLGIGGVYGINSIPAVGNVFRLSFSLSPFLTSLAVAVLLTVLGGLYPAYRASQLSPTEALRYE